MTIKYQKIYKTFSLSTRYIASIISIVLFSACGGGSGGSSTKQAVIVAPPLVIAPQENTIVSFDESPLTEESIELILYFPNTDITNIQWRQTSGPSITLVETQSKVIAFTAYIAGTYEFEASYQVNGESKSQQYSVTVSNPQAALVARLGHAVLSGNKVSLRISGIDAIDKRTLVWEQLSGPTVTVEHDDSGNKNTGFFNAPTVTEDTLITFEITGSSNANSYSDSVTILVEKASNIAQNSSLLFDERVAKTASFTPNSPYADALTSCVYNNTITQNDTCNFTKLPLIAHDTVNPDIDDIMNRVIVSHQWMGERFKEFLLEYDAHDDFKNLLRATTAIVISYDVRPSFYWGATGAIYLDPNSLWLTEDERDTINEAPDFRSSFGNDLNFVIPWRYVKNNDYISRYISPENRTSRSLSDIAYSLSSLLYHELAHANDYFAPQDWAQENRSDAILVIANNKLRNDAVQSDSLATQFPLNSTEMHALAQVSFQGETASELQKSYSPDDVALFFKQDNAPQYYNYSSIREDFAMLFDGFMMQARFGVSRDVAVTNKPVGDVIYANDYVVAWGQRGRIGEENIKPRVNFAVSKILPEFSLASDIINELPAPINMTPGDDWIENLSISPSIPAKTTIAGTALLNEKATTLKQFLADQPRLIEKPIPVLNR